MRPHFGGPSRRMSDVSLNVRKQLASHENQGTFYETDPTLPKCQGQNKRPNKEQDPKLDPHGGVAIKDVTGPIADIRIQTME